MAFPIKSKSKKVTSSNPKEALAQIIRARKAKDSEEPTATTAKEIEPRKNVKKQPRPFVKKGTK